jgi:hypothetical protein
MPPITAWMLWSSTQIPGRKPCGSRASRSFDDAKALSSRCVPRPLVADVRSLIPVCPGHKMRAWLFFGQAPHVRVPALDFWHHQSVAVPVLARLAGFWQ